MNLSGDYTHVDQPIRMSLLLNLNDNTFVTTPQNQWAVAHGVAPYDNRWLSPNYETNYAVFQPGDHEEIYGTNFTVSWQLLPSVQLKSITAFRESRVESGLAFSAAPSEIGDQTVREADDQTSQEFILSGKSFDKRLDWVTGLYYLRENIYSDIYLPLSFPANPVGYDTDSTNKGGNDSYAVYGQGTFHITDQLGLVLGARESSKGRMTPSRCMPTSSTPTSCRRHLLITPGARLLTGPDCNMNSRRLPRLCVNFDRIQERWL